MYNHILFQITFDCNLNCHFCDIKNQKKKIDINACMNNLKKKAGEIEWVYITGGEPFLVSNLADTCDELKNVGFKIGVTTNGTIFHPDIAEHVDRIGISIDGDKEFHDSCRGEGVFDKAINLLKTVKNRCETVVMSVALKNNQDALKRLKPLIEEIDPTYWQIQRDYNDSNVLITI